MPLVVVVVFEGGGCTGVQVSHRWWWCVGSSVCGDGGGACHAALQRQFLHVLYRKRVM